MYVGISLLASFGFFFCTIYRFLSLHLLPLLLLLLLLLPLLLLLLLHLSKYNQP